MRWRHFWMISVRLFVVWERDCEFVVDWGYDTDWEDGGEVALEASPEESRVGHGSR